jgi:tetratricopeptide (TPR) repeat protein
MWVSAISMQRRVMISRIGFFYNDALHHANQALEKVVHDEALRQDMGFIYGLRGYVYAQLGRYERARADFINAKNLDPKDLQNRRNLLRINETLRDKRLSLAVPVFTALLGVAGFASFIASFWFFFYKEVLHETQFVTMALAFFVLTIVCLYLSHVTRLKIGSVELEKVSIKSLTVPPKLEI